MKKYIVTTALFSMLLLFVTCKKKTESCPLQTYTMECEERTDDIFVGTVTSIHTYTFEAHCADEAAAFVNNQSYDFGAEYKHCRLK